MLFNSWVFAFYLPLVLAVYYLLPRRGQNAFLLAASYVFYGYWDWRFLSLLLVSTVVDYTADIRLRGWMRLIQPFAGGTLERIGRDAATGMTRTLAARAKAADQRVADHRVGAEVAG